MKYLSSLLLAWFSVGVAATSLAGHVFGNMKWASWLDGGVPMAISTAVAILALSGAVLLRFSKRSKNHKWHEEPTTIK